MTAVSWNLVLPPWDRADFPSLAIVPTATQSHMDPEASLSCHVHLQCCFLNFTFTPERCFSGNRILGWSLPQNIVPLSSDLHDLWRESSPSNCFVLIINALFFYGSFITFFGQPFSAIWLWCVWNGLIWVYPLWDGWVSQLVCLLYPSPNLVSHYFLKNFFQSWTFSSSPRTSITQTLSLCYPTCQWSCILFMFKSFSLLFISTNLC